MSKRLRGATYLATLAVVLSSACSGTSVSSPTRSPALTVTAITATTPSISSTATPAPATIAPFPTSIPGGSSACVSVDGLPDHNCTPGAVDPRVTQDNIQQTICVSGYTKTVRPSTSYTTPLKVRQMALYGWTGTTSDYEEDHLIAL